MSTIRERTLLCSDGIQLSAQEWLLNENEEGNSNDDDDDEDRMNILCLHGWLDNSASFYQIGPALLDKSRRVVALDFPGHGYSSHKSADGPPQLFSEYVFYVYEALRQLQYSKVTLVGHSMGAAVALTFASSFPEYVQNVILLDGAGPLARPIHSLTKYIQSSVLTRANTNPILFPQFQKQSLSENKPKKTRKYRSLDEATTIRMKTASLLPGKQYMSREAAQALVKRATTADDESSYLSFHHDVRLNWPSIQYFTQDQVNVIYENISCPVCLLRAEDGWPIADSSCQAIETILNPQTLRTLPGSHYFHADPETAPTVIAEINSFLHDTHFGTKIQDK